MTVRLQPDVIVFLQISEGGKKISFAQNKDEIKPLKNTDVIDGNTAIYQSTTVAILAFTKMYMLQNGYIIL